jgi:transcriptional regulator with XRE-family HTH domain/sRNA-binding regulator protein Hfq
MPYNSLRPIREKKGLTLAQLAGKTSISIRTLQSYEAGERTIAAEDLKKLSRVLFAASSEILQPSEPPPPEPVVTRPAPPVAPPSPRPSYTPPPSPSLEESHRPPVSSMETYRTPPPPAEAYRRPPPMPPRGEMRRPFPDGAPSPRPPMPRPPRPARAPRAPGPATAGQREQIRNLARRMGLDDVAVEERVGAPLATLDHLGARGAIAKLRQEMEDSGTWQPRVGEGVDQEGEYLGKLRDRHVGVVVQLINGERVEGVITDYTPYVIRVQDEASGSDVTVRKLAIAYYQTKGRVDDAQ